MVQVSLEIEQDSPLDWEDEPPIGESSNREKEDESASLTLRPGVFARTIALGAYPWDTVREAFSQQNDSAMSSGAQKVQIILRRGFIRDKVNLDRPRSWFHRKRPLQGAQTGMKHEMQQPTCVREAYERYGMRLNMDTPGTNRGWME